MKTFDFKLDKFQMGLLFSAIRRKEDVINVWMRAIKIMIAYVEPSPELVSGSLLLRVDKMSRLFFIDVDKSFSINFPFFTQEIDGELSFSSGPWGNIDNRISSEILSFIVTHDILSIEDIYLFMDPISMALEIDSSIWSIFKDLMTCDDGYLRFDHDTDREKGDIHPTNHIDIFYSNSSKFKIGLTNRFSITEFVDLLDTSTDCHFLYRK